MAPSVLREGLRPEHEVYSSLPLVDWKALKPKPLRRIELVLADGTPIERGVSEANLEIGGLRATTANLPWLEDSPPSE